MQINVHTMIPGGHNCKYGACNYETMICEQDFHKGVCKNNVIDGRCEDGVHLTLQNLKPFASQKISHDFPYENFAKYVVSEEDITL